MSHPRDGHSDDAYDPDDNFAHAVHDGAEVDEDADMDAEAVVWQVLLLVNPGDEDAALQQFGVFQEAWADAGGGDEGLEPLLLDAIEWKAGFRVGPDDTAALVDSINELAARWNLHVEWGVEDPTDAEFLAAAEVPSLLGVAYDRLREHGYTVWTWETAGGDHAGWITQARDDEAMRILAPALGIDAQPAG
ncbi:MAG: hypothetical protein R3278_08025 [Lysobacter spongiicola]|nr:hypothetical protein [Lysobacter spongiicola]